MPRSSHRLLLSCVKYRGRTRLYLLMGTFTFWSETTTVFKVQDTAWPGETEHAAYRLTSWQDALCYLTEALACACPCRKPQWRTWKITLPSANQKKAQLVFRLVLRYLTSITLQGKDPGALFGQQFCFPHFNLTTQVLWRPSKFADTVSISLTIAAEPCDECKCAYIQSSGCFKDYKPGKRKEKKKLCQGTLHMTVVFTYNLISLKQDSDRPFNYSVIRSVCTQCWTTCRHVSLSFLSSGWRFDRWAVLLCSLSDKQGAQRDGEIISSKAN